VTSLKNPPSGNRDATGWNLLTILAEEIRGEARYSEQGGVVRGNISSRPRA